MPRARRAELYRRFFVLKNLSFSYAVLLSGVLFACSNNDVDQWSIKQDIRDLSESQNVNQFNKAGIVRSMNRISSVASYDIAQGLVSSRHYDRQVVFYSFSPTLEHVIFYLELSHSDGCDGYFIDNMGQVTTHSCSISNLRLEERLKQQEVAWNDSSYSVLSDISSTGRTILLDDMTANPYQADAEGVVSSIRTSFSVEAF